MLEHFHELTTLGPVDLTKSENRGTIKECRMKKLEK